MTYQQRIRQIRISKGINQKQLAAMIFVTPPIISYIENKKRQTTVEMLQRIADDLGVNIKEFFED